MASPGARRSSWQAAQASGWFAHQRPDELLLGEDDCHLDFRVSVLPRNDGARQWATVTTAVQFHNPWGRAYFALVRPSIS